MFLPQPTPFGASFGSYHGLSDGFIGGGFPVQGAHPTSFVGSSAGCGGCSGSAVGGQQHLQAFELHHHHHPQQQQQQQQQLLTMGQVPPPPPPPPPPPTFHTNHHNHHHQQHHQHYQNQRHHQQQQQQQQLQLQLPLPPQYLPHLNHHANSPRRTIAAMDDASPQDDVAAQEAAARDYQPQLEGPLVGDRTTSHAITEQYAKADPVYVEKTIALPQTYSHYRPIQGDGNCGWRAIGFAYFETLILTATPAKIAAEIARITELGRYIENVGGFQRFLWEDMADETMLILNDIQANLANPDVALASLQAKFNEGPVSDAVIYHLRLMAASYLKGNVDNYEPFIGGSAKDYSAGTIEPSNREIEHVGIILLVEVLLKPADFVLEIVYLDRTPMSKANTYRFPGGTNDRAESDLGPIIHLLFRPDHYDILYKPPPEPVDVQVHRAAAFTHQFQIGPTSIAPCGPMDNVVDFGLILSMASSYNAGAGNPLDPMLPFGMGPAAYTPSPEAQQPPPPWGETACSQHNTPAPSASPACSIITPNTHHQEQSPPMQQQLEHQQPPPPPPAEHVQSTVHLTPSPSLTHALRFSKYSYPTKTPDGAEDVHTVDDQALAFAAVTEYRPATTRAFEHSHFNPAHYANPNFQPDMYHHPPPYERRRSTDDDASEGTSGTAKRKKKEKPPIKTEPKEDV
ncbi:ubiquitin thioesterase [Magnaporthiopsis poae ATCC 64411]|uniref:ubiquitinyl hydrolase 1 n=1 Tax=Magnaporthiopsis poae (strain ATCC 64411 / 73-15) TaxID=644358 RepID=A0A0C4DPW7_MAGP6|nr:ubiquitin thioesterase [Magnaporthiopsis poae ATCC 64411]